jgi:hypothetical protein
LEEAVAVMTAGTMELVVTVFVEPRLLTITADVVAVVVLIVIVVMTAEVG